MPSRLIARLAMDYLLRWNRIVSDLHEADLLLALVHATAFQASTDHLDLSRLPESGGAEGEGLRSISVYALAAALGQPRETVRRKVQRLIALGQLVETPTGVRVSAEELEDERGRAALVRLAMLTRELLASLSELGLASASNVPSLSGQEARALLARTSNTYCLRLIEDMSRLAGGDLIRPLVFAAVDVCNTRHLRSDRFGQYARIDKPLPDAMRAPVTAIALARELGLPRETTRRYLAKVEADGACRRVRGGFIADEAVVQTPAARNLAERIVANTRRLVANLPMSVLDAATD